jgi:hypothetical protein
VNSGLSTLLFAKRTAAWTYLVTLPLLLIAIYIKVQITQGSQKV